MNRYSGIYVISVGSIMGKKRITNCCEDNENLFTLLTSSLLLALPKVGLCSHQINGLFVGTNPIGSFLNNALPNVGTVIANLAGLKHFFNGGVYPGCNGGILALQAACNKLAEEPEPKIYAVVSGNQTYSLKKKDESTLLVTNDFELARGCGSYFIVQSIEPRPLVTGQQGYALYKSLDWEWTHGIHLYSNQLVFLTGCDEQRNVSVAELSFTGGRLTTISDELIKQVRQDVIQAYQQSCWAN